MLWCGRGRPSPRRRGRPRRTPMWSSGWWPTIAPRGRSGPAPTARSGRCDAARVRTNAARPPRRVVGSAGSRRPRRGARRAGHRRRTRGRRRVAVSSEATAPSRAWPVLGPMSPRRRPPGERRRRLMKLVNNCLRRRGGRAAGALALPKPAALDAAATMSCRQRRARKPAREGVSTRWRIATARSIRLALMRRIWPTPWTTPPPPSADDRVECPRPFPARHRRRLGRCRLRRGDRGRAGEMKRPTPYGRPRSSSARSVRCRFGSTRSSRRAVVQ